MTREEFNVLQHWLLANRRVGQIIDKYVQEHQDDFKFDLPPLGSHEFDKKDADLENFYCGGL